MFTFLSTHLAKRLFSKLDNIDQQKQMTYIAMIAGASLALLILLLSTWWYSLQSHYMTQGTINHYGEGLASLAADRIATTTLHQDPISLQAVVRAIANKKAVRSVATYDVNNNILAQADKQQTPSNPNPAATRLQYYTAPVTISSNLAGSITIGIDPVAFNGSINYLPIWCMALLLIAISLIAYRHLRLLQSSRGSANNRMATEYTTVQQQLESEPSHIPDNTLVTLNIQLINIDTLHQQLNAESRQLQLQRLQQDIEHTAALYSALPISITNNSIVLNFGNTNKDNIFNALCCGQLLLRLNQENPKAIIAITNTVQCIPEDYQLANILPKIRASYHISNGSHQLLVDPDIIDTHQLDERITLSHTEDDAEVKTIDEAQHQTDMHFLAVKEFKTSYATLINNQLVQLQKQHTH